MHVVWTSDWGITFTSFTSVNSNISLVRSGVFYSVAVTKFTHYMIVSRASPQWFNGFIFRVHKMHFSQLFSTALSEKIAHSTVYLHLSDRWADVLQLDCWLRWWYTVEWAVSSESVMIGCNLELRWHFAVHISLCRVNYRYAKVLMIPVH